MMDMYSRNIGIFDVGQQSAIRDCRLLVMGCGLGSVIAELAIRTGFQSLTIVDGDTVDETNLNRQAFTYKDVGRKKVDATSERCLAINPAAKIDVVCDFATSVSVLDLVSSADIVIDVIDLSAIDVIFALHEEARQQSKVVLFPLNLAFGAGVFVFDKGSPSLESMLGMDGVAPEKALASYKDGSIFEEWVGVFGQHLPEYAASLLGSFLSNVKTRGWCPLPQVGIAAYTSAAMTVAAAAKVACGLPVERAPKLISLDAWNQL